MIAENQNIRRTSTVTTSIPAGFHRLRFQPSTHIAPRLSKLTVPSPSPILTPFVTYPAHVWFIKSQRPECRQETYLWIRLFIREFRVDPAGSRKWHVQRRTEIFAVPCRFIRAEGTGSVGNRFVVFVLSSSIPSYQKLTSSFQNFEGGDIPVGTFGLLAVAINTVHLHRGRIGKPT